MIGLRTSLSTDQSVEVSNLRSRPGLLAVRRKGSSQLSAVMSCPIRYVRQVGQRRRRRAETAVGVSMGGPRRRHAGLTAGRVERRSWGYWNAMPQSAPEPLRTARTGAWWAPSRRRAATRIGYPAVPSWSQWFMRHFVDCQPAMSLR
jgi:hypothetical protein